MKVAPGARIALLALALLLCAACAQETAAPPQPSFEPLPPMPIEEPEARAGAQVTMAMDASMPWYPRMAKVAEHVNELLRLKGVGVTLKIVGVRELDERQLPKCPAGTDILVWPKNDDHKALIEQGIVQPIVDIRGRDLFAVMGEEVWKECARGGEIWCVPTPSDSRDEASLDYVIWYDALLFARQGIDPPMSVEELVRVSRSLGAMELPHMVTFDPDYPPYPLHRLYDQWPFYVDRQSAFVYYGDGSVEKYVGSDVFAQDIQNLQLLREAGVLHTLSSAEADTTGLGATRFPDVMGSFTGQAGFWTEDGKAAVLAPARPGFRTLPAVNAGSYILADSNQYNEAMALLEAIWTDERIHDLMTFGVEGEDYLVDEDGLFQMEVEQYNGHFLTTEQWIDRTVGRAEWQRRWDNQYFRRPEYISFPIRGFDLTAPSTGNIAIVPFECNAVGLLYRRGDGKPENLPLVVEKLDGNGYGELLDIAREQYAAHIDDRVL